MALTTSSVTVLARKLAPCDFPPPMPFSFTKLRGVKCALLALSLSGTAALRAEDWALSTTGVRIGLPASKSGKDFWRAEGLVGWTLPWDWSFCNDWNLDSRLDLTAGWLGDGYKNAAVVTLGPSFGLHHKGWPVSLEGGVSPTFISRYDFVSKDFGSYFQFTSHAGLTWQFVKHFSIGYQFQHMSDAGISEHNPGLNLQVIELRYIF